MRAVLIILMFSCVTLNAIAQSGKSKSVQKHAKSEKMQIAEASCGQCKFGMAGTGCQLAVRIDGKAYFVDGTAIDKHGDAHGETGFCNTIRKAEVKGKIVDNRFVAKSFKLLPVEMKP